RLRPDGWQARVSLAQVHREQKRIKEAVALLDEAARVAPQVAAIYRTRAHFQRERGDRQGALRDLDRAVRLGPPANADLIADDHVAGGRLLKSLGRHGDALRACDEALRLRPHLAAANGLRGEVLLALKRFGEAERAYSRCVRQGGADGDVYRGRGLARMQVGD